MLRPDPAATPIAVMSVNVSFLAGYKGFANCQTGEWLIYEGSTNPTVTTGRNMNYVWLFELTEMGDYNVSPVRLNENIQNPWRLVADDPNRKLLLSQTLYDSWWLYPDDNGRIAITASYGTDLINSDATLESTPSYSYNQYPDNLMWELISNSPFVTSIASSNFAYVGGGIIYESDVENFITLCPAENGIHNLVWYYSDNCEPLNISESEDYCELEYGVREIYCHDTYSNVESNDIMAISHYFPGADSKKTYSIHPYGADAMYLTRAGSGGSNANTVAPASVAGFANISEAGGDYYRVDNFSQTFVVESNPDGSYAISTTMNTAQYELSAPDRDAVKKEMQGWEQIIADYTLPDPETFANYLQINSSGALEFGMKNDQCKWGIIPIGNTGYYAIVTGVVENGQNVVKGLRYQDGQLSVANYVASDTTFRWKFDNIGVNAPLIKQTTDYYCGPATVLQAFYGAGIGQNVAGNGLHAQISTLATHIGTTEQNGTSRYNIHDKINSFSLFANYSSLRYGAYSISDKATPDLNETQMIGKMTNSLNLGWAPFINTAKGERPYQIAGANTGHFIAVVGYDSRSGYAYIANCSYVYTVNQPPAFDFFGIFAVKYEKMYEATRVFYCCEQRG